MIYDVIIIGGGPAGLTAGIYASRARLKTLLLESITISTQAVTTSEIENYPGFPEGASGFDLIEKFKKQAVKFGTEIKAKTVKSLKETKAEGKNAWLVEADGETFSAFSVILASGAKPKKLGIPGESKFIGRGVSYCAVCDAAFFKEKSVVVIGGGDTAIEDAVFLTKFAKKVTVIHRRDRLRATKILQERALSNKRIEFALNSVAIDIMGDKKVTSVQIENVKTKEKKEILADGVFVLIGYEPNTEFLKGTVKMDEKGYVISDDDMRASVPGLFACGDLRKKLLSQVVTAAGEGATASHSARLYVEEIKGESYGV